MWLDRGELDKIIERSSEPLPSLRREVDHDDRDGSRYDDRDRYDDRRNEHDRGRRGKRKESFLGDLFDF